MASASRTRSHHSAFSRARNERFRDSDIFPRVFERVIGAGLVGGEGFAVDASLIVADANKQRSVPGSEWSKELDPKEVGRAVKEYLATLDDRASGNQGLDTPLKPLRPTSPLSSPPFATKSAPSRRLPSVGEMPVGAGFVHVESYSRSTLRTRSAVFFAPSFRMIFAR